MKALLSCVFCVFMSGLVHSQVVLDAVNNLGAIIEFEETEYDFGYIHSGEKVEHEFAFRNSGEKPLIISNVITSCGCTAPEWPREPIAPGKDGKIKVIFNSTGKSGTQHKVITIKSNAPTTKIAIKTIIVR